MKFQRNIIAFVTFFFSFFILFNVAQADFFSNVSSGIIDIISSLNQNPAIVNFEQSFCSNYFSSASNQNYFQSSFGSAICTDNPSLSNTASQTILQTSSLTSLFSGFGNILTPVLQTSAATSSQNPTVPTSVSVQAPASATVQTQAPSTFTDEAPETVISTTTNATAEPLDDSEILYWTNIARADNATSTPLSPLAENSILDSIAVLRINDMFTNQYFAHVSPITGANVSTIAPQQGYQFITIGENIALGNFGDSRDLVTDWMNSPGHRANILNDTYTQIGVAAQEGMYQGQEVWIADQVFGKPASDCPSPSASLKSEIDSDQTTANTESASLTSMQSQLKSLESSSSTAYNQLLAQYNSSATTYNTLIANLKTLVAQYNADVVAYNNCI